MSSMLEQAIIDAKQLRESAQKNAEEAVIEKYQIEIKEAIDKILEQDDLGIEGDETGLGMDPAADMDMDMDMGAEPEAEEGGEPQVDAMLDQLPFVQTTDDNQYVNLDLTKLEEAMGLDNDPLGSSTLEEGLPMPTPHEDLDEEIELDEELEAFSEEDELDEAELDVTVDGRELDPEQVQDLLDLDEEILEALMALDEEDEILEEEDLEEKCAAHDDVPLEEDTAEEEAQKGKSRDKDDGPGAGGGYKRGYKDEPMEDLPFQENIQKENKTLLREQKKLGNKVQLLENQLNKYNTVITKLKNKLDESSLTNAKLLYQNRVLDSVSLNERQKDKIVEAIKNANSVEEAKIIFETLQSTVGEDTKKTRRKMPESLNEVVSRGSSAFMPRKEVKQKVDPFAERMKRLAGLKN